MKLVCGLLCAFCISLAWRGYAAEPGQLPILAPGVLTVVPAEPQEGETATPPLDLDSIASQTFAWDPNFDATSETLLGLSRDVILRRFVWQLEFAYKPLRMIQVPVAGATGQNSTHAVWYLVYRVSNPGRHLAPIPEKDEYGHDAYELKLANAPLRFFPTFRLRDQERGVEWMDRILPEAVARIHAIEIRDPRVPLYDSVQISQRTLEVNSQAMDRGLWGVATWQGVDSRSDFLSVFVQGLSNAYRWEPTGEKGPRNLTFKTLQLNFWRPGDPVDEHVGEFRNGLPSFTEDQLAKVLRLYQLHDPADFLWIYRK